MNGYMCFNEFMVFGRHPRNLDNMMVSCKSSQTYNNRLKCKTDVFGVEKETGKVFMISFSKRQTNK